MPQQQVAGDTFGDRLLAARRSKGLSRTEASFAIRDYLPRAMWVSGETIRRLEAGLTPVDKADAVLVQALANVYDIRLADLSEELVIDLERVRDLLSRSTG